jgi:paraquat-inducible protein A
MCGLIQHLGPVSEGMVAECSRCGSRILKARRDSLGRTAALSLAALVLYVPANLYPIMRMEFHGVFTESTVWDGCVRLFQDGQWLVAIIVFLASLLIPLLKLVALFFLVISTRLNSQRAQVARARIYAVIEVIGPWAMLDVFLLAILVALVKLGRIATVTPGPGLLAFASVVVLTLLASASFDPRQLWERSDPDP